MTQPITIDMWSDYVCPYCYIGLRRLSGAIAQTQLPVQIRHRAYQLHPSAPADRSMPIREFWPLVYPPSDKAENELLLQRIAATGREVGLDLNYQIMQHCNTFTPHRLTAWAASEGKSEAMAEALFNAYFSRGQSLNDPDSLVALAEEAELDADKARSIVADTSLFADEVTQDIAAAKKMGISGVPFFILNGRLALNGAQPQAVFVEALRRAAEQEDTNQ